MQNNASCVGALCPNGVINSGEACDDGNPSNLDQCNVTCGLTMCGDGITQVLNGYNQNEQCDDGNLNNNDGCSSTCQLELCGNGVINLPGESCDGTNLNGKDCTSISQGWTGGQLACFASGIPNQCKFNNASCVKGPVCGNNVLESPEQCDDGNVVSGDGCSATCQNETGNCPTEDGVNGGLTGCRASQPAHSNTTVGYTCLSGQQCYVCKNGYKWDSQSGICDPVSTACYTPPYGGLCSILTYVPECITYNSVFVSTACCQGCGLGYDYACEENVVPY